MLSKRGAAPTSRSSRSKPDSTGMVISTSAISGCWVRMAWKPLLAVEGHADPEAAIDKLLGDQTRGFTVVVDAEHMRT